MKANPVIYTTLIIRCQMEYSRITHGVSMRCILEMPATEQHFGFTRVEDLLTALRAELLETKYRILSMEQEKSNSGE